jgi:magnesium transporter
MQQQGMVIIEVDLHTRHTESLSITQLQIAPQNPNKIYWIHCDSSQETEFAALKEKLPLPETVNELCEEKESRSKMITTLDSLAILLQAPRADKLAPNGEAIITNLVIRLDAQFCFTASHQSNLPIEYLVKNYLNAVPYAKTPCFVLFLVLSETINTYSDLIYDFQMLSEKIDINIKQMAYEEIVEMKRQLMRTKRYISSIHDMLMRMSARKISVISEDCRLSLNSLIIQSEALVNEAESLREFFHSLLEQIDNALMQKLNITMKVLTGFSAILLPLSLITGIYGMNFTEMPELSWHYGYFGALGLMASLGLGLFYLFKRKGWL